MKKLFICFFVVFLSLVKLDAAYPTYAVMPAVQRDILRGRELIRISKLKERTFQHIAYTLTCHTDPNDSMSKKPINSSIFEDLAIISFCKIFENDFEEMRSLILKSDFSDFLTALFISEACYVGPRHYFIKYTDILRKQYTMQKERLTLESIPEVNEFESLDKTPEEKAKLPEIRMISTRDSSRRLNQLKLRLDKWIPWLEELSRVPLNLENFYKTSEGEYLYRTKRVVEIAYSIPFHMIHDQPYDFAYLKDKYTKAFYTYRSILMKALRNAKQFLQNLLESLCS